MSSVLTANNEIKVVDSTQTEATVLLHSFILFPANRTGLLNKNISLYVQT